MKQYLTSKTLWANVIAIIAIVSAGQFDYVLDGTAQATMLVTMNMILRTITKEPLVWSTK